MEAVEQAAPDADHPLPRDTASPAEVMARVRARLSGADAGTVCCAQAELAGVLVFSRIVTPGAVPPAGRVAVPCARSVGQRLAVLAQALGLGFTPWQAAQGSSASWVRSRVFVPASGRREPTAAGAGLDPGLFVFDDAGAAARRALLSRAGGPVVTGLPSAVVLGPPCDLAAVWRGAVIAAGVAAVRTRGLPLEVTAPNEMMQLAMSGAARRLGVRTAARSVPDGVVIVVRDTAGLLEHVGAGDLAGRWAQAAWRDPRAGLSVSPQSFANANRARAAQAAHSQAQRCAQVLASCPDVPEHLAAAGRLRVAHPDAPLADLGALASPPMSKDAIAGQLRRLLAWADGAQARRPAG